MTLVREAGAPGRPGGWSWAISRSRKVQARLGALAAYAVLIVFSLFAVAPFFYLLSPALRPGSDLFKYPPEWIPWHPYFGNFGYLIHHTNFIRWSVNTFVVASFVTVIALFIDSLAGYAFARITFPGRQALLVTVLATLMMPLAALLAPLYLIVKWLGWINTYYGLIIPMVASPLGVFMMRQFVLLIPPELFDAARVDGASHWTIYRRIALPVLRPSLALLGIVVFLSQWVNFLWPLVAVNKDKMRTLTVGISTFQGTYVTTWGVIAAASFLAMVPIGIVFLIFQRWFVRASLAGALKG